MDGRLCGGGKVGWWRWLEGAFLLYFIGCEGVDDVEEVVDLLVFFGECGLEGGDECGEGVVAGFWGGGRGFMAEHLTFSSNQPINVYFWKSI